MAAGETAFKTRSFATYQQVGLVEVQGPGAQSARGNAARTAAQCQRFAVCLPLHPDSAQLGGQAATIQQHGDPWGCAEPDERRHADLNRGRPHVHAGGPFTGCRFDGLPRHEQQPQSRQGEGDRCHAQQCECAPEGFHRHPHKGLATVMACHGPDDCPATAAQYQAEVSVKVWPLASSMCSHTRMRWPARSAMKQRQ